MAHTDHAKRGNFRRASVTRDVRGATRRADKVALRSGRFDELPVHESPTRALARVNARTICPYCDSAHWAYC